MSEKGTLLFRVLTTDRWRYLWFVWLALLVVLVATAVWRHKQPNWPLIVFFTVYAVVYFVWRRAAVYENGIRMPADTSGARGRFIAWSQIARFSWEDDVLTIVPTSSIMSGADLGQPLLGGAVRVPAARREQMEQLLARIPANAQ